MGKASVWFFPFSRSMIVRIYYHTKGVSVPHKTNNSTKFSIKLYIIVSHICVYDKDKKHTLLLLLHIRLLLLLLLLHSKIVHSLLLHPVLIHLVFHIANFHLDLLSINHKTNRKERWLTKNQCNVYIWREDRYICIYRTTGMLVLFRVKLHYVIAINDASCFTAL